MSALRRWRVGLLGLLVSLIAVVFITSEIDFDLLGEAVAQARWVFVLPTLLLLFIGLFARGQRWRVLLSGGLPYWRAFHIMNVAYLVNGVLPLRMGELARVFLAARGERPVPVFTTASTVIVERLLDLLAVVIMLALALVAGPLPDRFRSAGLVMGALAAGGFGLLVVLSRRRNLAHRLLAVALRVVPALRRFQPEQRLDHFLDGLAPLARWQALMQALWWTAAAWALSAAAGFVLMYTFFDTASLTTTFLYIAAAALVIAVPGMVGSVGLYEASILFALEASGYGEPASTAVAFAVTVHFVNVLVHTLTGMVGFMAEGVTLTQLTKGVRQIEGESSMGRSTVDVPAPTTEMSNT